MAARAAGKRQARRRQPSTMQRFFAALRRVWPGRPDAWLLPVAMLCVLGLSAVAGWWLWQEDSLPLRTVRVQGALQHVDAGSIRAAVLPHADAGFFHVDIHAVQAVVAQLPWVQDVHVSRSWPDVLQLRIREQQVLARWGDGGLISPAGRVFYPQENIVTRLPQLEGPQGTSVLVTAQFIALQQALLPLGLNIVRVVMDERRAWRLFLDGGLELVLGRSEHPVRVERFLRAWPELLAPRSEELARVDLRYTNGFAVTFRQSGL